MKTSRKKTKKRKMSEIAYDQIKHMIMHFELKPGECIPEEKIAKIINSSRTPVREALLKLNEEGLVKTYPGRFSKVADFDEEDVKQIGMVRLSQDILSCQLAIRNGSNRDFDKLKKIAKQCEASAKEGNVYERIVLDSEFHIEISKIGRNEILIQNQERLYTIINLIQISKYTNIEDSVAQIESHQDMIEAFYNRDSKRTNNIVCNHLQSFYNIDQEIIDMYTFD